MPYHMFLEYLDAHSLVKDLDKGQLMQRMRDLMIDCHAAAVPLLDPRKRPGFKFELIGFDFILDEDLRVWLIEVNTCPYLGAVLPQEQPSFMLDLIDDTLKLTADQYFFPGADPAELQSQTEYELLWSADGTVNKRTMLKSDAELSTPTETQNQTASTKESEASKQGGQLGWFPLSLYPSKEIHSELIKS